MIPLTARAILIVRYIRAYNRDLEGPFYSATGKVVRLDSLNNVFDRWHERRYIDDGRSAASKPEKFTARGIRRTANYLLTDVGVRPEDGNLLQSHGQTGVVIKHYDRHHHLPVKRMSMRMYEKVLSRIITNKKQVMQELNER